MFEKFKTRMSRIGANQSDAYLKGADTAINETFKRDPAYREVKITHAPSGIRNVSYDAKFKINTYYNILKDEVDYYLQFRPHTKIPTGSYVDIPDDEGVLQRWLIVAKDDRPQFPQYYVLKCNWNLKWIYDGKVYSCMCAHRSQQSYSAGTWTDRQFTVPDNQSKMWLPTTPYTQTLFYDTRILMSDVGRDIPLAFTVTKVEDTQPLGVTKLTFKQDVADLHEDCGRFGIANFCKSSGTNACETCSLAEPIYIDAGLEMPVTDIPVGKISYNGVDNTLRVGGSAKTFIVSFWDDEHHIYVEHKPMWKLAFKDIDTLLCSIDLNFDSSQSDGDALYLTWHVSLAEDCPADITLDQLKFDNVSATTGVADGCTISCLRSGKTIFNVHVEPLVDDVNALVLKCSQLYSMVGKSIVVSAANDQGQYAAETTMEVIS